MPQSQTHLTHEMCLFVATLPVCLCVQSTGKTQQKDVFNSKLHMSVTVL